MSDIFPKWTNRLPLQIIVGVVTLGVTATAAIWYYVTPQYSRVGYQPVQPVPFSHSIHADQLGLDCRYCHDGVESSWYSNVPSSSVCMNCHNQILTDSPKLEPVRSAYESDEPINWVQIHRLSGYVYFNHSVHVNRGVSCVHCHGEVHKMDEVSHAKPFSMMFCLECHRDPSQYLRDPGEVYNLDLEIPRDVQETRGAEYVHDWKVNASQNCSACHR